jgi:hypothetical protein
MGDLLLEQASGGHYNVLADGKVVGHIMLSDAAPVATPWIWTLAHGLHEDRMPTRGYAATPQAAMQAFARSWHRECWTGIAGSASSASVTGRSSSSAAHPEGCTEAIIGAESIPADVLIELVQSGLAMARNERINDEDGIIEVTRVWITKAGMRFLAARG